MRTITLTLLAVATIFVLGCVSPKTPQVRDVTAKEAADLIEASRGGLNLTILDVRTPGEYSEGRIGDAVNIDFNGADFKGRLDSLDREKTYIVYCRSGKRSVEAAKVMAGLGFRRTYNLIGGVDYWKLNGYSVS